MAKLTICYGASKSVLSTCDVQGKRGIAKTHIGQENHHHH